MVDGDIEEPLNLRRVQVHEQRAVRAGVTSKSATSFE